MKIIGILAKKLDHSLSPTIHNHWSKKTKTNLRYKKFEVKEKKLVNLKVSMLRYLIKKSV